MEDILNGEFEFLVTNYGIAAVARFDLRDSAWGKSMSEFRPSSPKWSEELGSNPHAAVSHSERHRTVRIPP